MKAKKNKAKYTLLFNQKKRYENIALSCIDLKVVHQKVFFYSDNKYHWGPDIIYYCIGKFTIR